MAELGEAWASTAGGQSTVDFAVGDRVELYVSTAETEETRYEVSDWVRYPSLLVLVGLFVLISVAIARGKGLRASLATLANLAIAILTFINIWLGVPFNMALLLAGLQGIPHELYEAADIDGASKSSKFWHITLPILRPALFAVGLLGLIYTFKVFDLIWVTTGGGPVNATHVLSTVAFQMVFQQFSFGPGAAVLNTLFVVLFFVSLLYLWTTAREEAL